MPFGLMASEMMGWLYYGGGMGFWQEAMAEFGIRPFFAGSSGVSAGGWFRKEINSLEDLKGLKFRIAGLGAEVVQRLGATPVLTPPAEVFPAMAAGTVDAAEFIGPWNDQAFGLYRVAKYYYQPGWHEVGPTAELLVNRRPSTRCRPTCKAIVEAAATASAMEYHADYAFHNVDQRCSRWSRSTALELRLFPDDVVAALGRTSHGGAGRARRAHARSPAGSTPPTWRSARRPIVYSQWFDLPMLRMRAAALGQGLTGAGVRGAMTPSEGA